MNLFYKNFSARIAAGILCAQIFAGCSKEQGAEEVSGSDATLSVSVLGVADREETTSTDGKTTSSIHSAVNPAPAPDIQQFNGFDVLVSEERDSDNQKRISLGRGGKGASGSVMAAALPTGVKYRLMLYRSNGTFVSSTTLTSGSASNLMVRKGFTYNWYAVSYNSTDSVPTINTATPTLAIPDNTDLLYAKGSINIPANAADGTTPLGIVFNHRLARVGIEINSMGMFAQLVGANHTISGTIVKRGTLNLRSGALSNLTSYTPALSFRYLDANRDRAAAYMYTADSTTNNNLTFNLTGLEISLDVGGTRNFTNILQATPATFPLTISPVIGQSRRAVINLLESPITLLGVRWARNNLYYTAGHNPYRFQHTYRSNSNLNSFFSYRGTLPQTFATGGLNGGGDPCALVYPAGVWRQPTTAEFATLANVALLQNTTGRALTYHSDATGNYYQYAGATGQASPYPDNQLRFYLNGNGSGATLVNGLIDVSLGNAGNQVHVWTATSALSIPLLNINVGAYFYEGITAVDALTSIRTNFRRQNAQALNISAIGLQVVQSDFKNVRCVRN